jgi:hypothetical protein
MMYRGNNRIQAYSAKNRPVFGLGSSFGEPQEESVCACSGHIYLRMGTVDPN